MYSYKNAGYLKVSVVVLMMAVLQLQYADSLPPDFFRFGFVLGPTDYSWQELISV